MMGERDTEHRKDPGRRAAAPLRCTECGARSDVDALGWRGYRMEDPEEGDAPALAFYCPFCAQREFGEP
jgi:hypothetical protein